MMINVSNRSMILSSIQYEILKHKKERENGGLNNGMAWCMESVQDQSSTIARIFKERIFCFTLDIILPLRWRQQVRPKGRLTIYHIRQVGDCIQLAQGRAQGNVIPFPIKDVNVLTS
jgi:hypothetical protein